MSTKLTRSSYLKISRNVNEMACTTHFRTFSSGFWIDFNRKTSFDVTTVIIVNDIEWMKERDKVKWKTWLNKKNSSLYIQHLQQLMHIHIICMFYVAVKILTFMPLQLWLDSYIRHKISLVRSLSTAQHLLTFQIV